MQLNLTVKTVASEHKHRQWLYTEICTFYHTIVSANSIFALGQCCNMQTLLLYN